MAVTDQKITINNSNSVMYTSSVSSASLNSYQTVNGDFKIDGSLQINGVDIEQSIAEIKERLAIITPDYEKMEKFAALKNAYENYKMIERLLGEQ